MTGAFFKNSWERIKMNECYKETEFIGEEGIQYFEGLSDDEFYSMRYGAKLYDFSDAEIVEEFNYRMNSPLHKICLEIKAKTEKQGGNHGI